MVSLVMDDLSSYNLARPIGPMSPTLKRRQPMASVAVAAAAAAALLVVVAAAAIVVVALSIACLHSAPNGQMPMSLGRDYRKSDRWLVPLILSMWAMSVENRPVSMQSTEPNSVCAVCVESLRIPVASLRWAHTGSVPAETANSYD